ncbi:hypothetical protein [Promicromonospora sp. NPDC019610]|uniref:hypothetical protein n=1 Tax=Promicromonospora sp. NPDC019610 TaxID=3364405 RepID=UPI003792CC6D
MPDPGSHVPHRLVEATAMLSKVPSSIPVVVLPDDVLTWTAGPVPVLIRHGGHSGPAWAWAERAWDGSDAPSGRVDGQEESTPAFWLSRLAIERLGLGPGTAAVSLAIPEPKTLRPVLPLVHDVPGNDEVQVAPVEASGPSRQIMVHNGVAAWVTLVPRAHVRPGTARISNQLRVITGQTSSGAIATDALFFQPVAGAPRPRRRVRTFASLRTRLRSATEHGLRWFFLAPEQSFRVAPAHPDDEHQHVVALHEVALSRLGVRSGDDVILRWGTTEVEVPAVADHAPVASGPSDHTPDPTRPPPARDMPPHLAARVPTALRHVMDLPGASVITVRRSTRSVLARNLNSLVIPVASLALAGAALNDPNWALLTCGAVATAVLGLSRLRMGNRRAVRLRD